MTIQHDTRQLTDAVQRIPIDWLRFAPWAVSFLSSDAAFKLCRGGNQIGKSTMLIYDILHFARHTHPYRKTPAGPVNLLVLSESWEQMGQAGGFMEKLWNLCPKHELDPKISFDPGRGITGKPPRLLFTSGPGAGSVITLATFRQGARRVAGSTVHGVWTDEPPPGTLLEELTMRLMKHGGQLTMDFTPVLDMPDQRQLKKLVADGTVAEWNPWLCEESVWPVGAPFPWLPREQIERSLSLCSPAVRGMRERADWEPVHTDTMLPFFDRARHVRPAKPKAGAMIAVGIDHGSGSLRQAGVLVAAAATQTLRPRVWVWGEATTEKAQTMREFAVSLLSMLRARGVSWRDVDRWVGDRPTTPDRDLRTRTNAELRAHLAELVGVPVEEFPAIETPIKRAGSVEHGCALINGVAALTTGDEPHLVVDPSCERFAEFLERFDGDPKHELKDVGDAGRYAVERLIRGVEGYTLTASY